MARLWRNFASCVSIFPGFGPTGIVVVNAFDLEVWKGEGRGGSDEGGGGSIGVGGGRSAIPTVDGGSCAIVLVLWDRGLLVWSETGPRRPGQREIAAHL